MAGASVARRAFLAAAYREAQATDGAVQTKHPLAPQVVEVTLLTVEADAQTEATRRQALFGTGRGIYEIPLPLNDDTETLDLGDVIQVTHPRYGMAAGKLLRVLGVKPDAAAETLVVTGWG